MAKKNPKAGYQTPVRQTPGNQIGGNSSKKPTQLQTVKGSEGSITPTGGVQGTGSGAAAAGPRAGKTPSVGKKKKK